MYFRVREEVVVGAVGNDGSAGVVRGDNAVDTAAADVDAVVDIAAECTRIAADNVVADAVADGRDRIAGVVAGVVLRY